MDIGCINSTFNIPGDPKSSLIWRREWLRRSILRRYCFSRNYRNNSFNSRLEIEAVPFYTHLKVYIVRFSGPFYTYNIKYSNRKRWLYHEIAWRPIVYGGDTADTVAPSPSRLISPWRNSCYLWVPSYLSDVQIPWRDLVVHSNYYVSIVYNTTQVNSLWLIVFLATPA